MQKNHTKFPSDTKSEQERKNAEKGIRKNSFKLFLKQIMAALGAIAVGTIVLFFREQIATPDPVSLPKENELFQVILWVVGFLALALQAFWPVLGGEKELAQIEHLNATIIPSGSEERPATYRFHNFRWGYFYSTKAYSSFSARKMILVSGATLSSYFLFTEGAAILYLAWFGFGAALNVGAIAWESFKKQEVSLETLLEQERLVLPVPIEKITKVYKLPFGDQYEFKIAA